SVAPTTKLHPKTAPFPHLGFNADAASHLFSDLSDNGQADASSFVIIVEPLKHAKEAVANAIGYAHAIVLDPDTHGLIPDRLGADPNVWTSAGSDEFDRVAQQVREALDQKRLAAQHHGQRFFQTDLGRIRMKIRVAFNQVAEQAAEVHRLDG